MKTFFKSVLKHIDRLDATKLREQYRLATDEIAFFETVLKAMREGVIVYGRNGDVIYRNAAAAALPDLDVPLGKASRREFAVTYPEIRDLEVQTIPMERGDTLALIRDVSAEKSRTAEELAQGAAKSVSALAAGVAHEIGNPLNAIALNLQMLERDPTDRESIDICKEQVKRLDGIIREFLTALRPTRPNLAPGSMAEPVTHCISALKRQLADRGIKVTMNLPSGLPTVALDHDQMEQVFFNLVKNAMEAMADGGEIDITVRSDDTDVAVEIRDSGVGMTGDQLAHLFEPYRTTKEKGNGLGLMITARIVRDHGGTIDAESAVGEGTVFTVKLPRIERRVRELK